MSLLDYLPDDGVMINLTVTSKKHLFEHVSALAASLNQLQARSVFDALMQRERLGSTSIGGGMAIPHAVFADLAESMIILTILTEPISFGAQDRKPIDIICTIIGPGQADCNHLKLVSAAAKQLGQADIASALRNSITPFDVRKCFEANRASAA